MPSPRLVAAALDALVRHQLTGCTRAAGRAACLLDRLTSSDDLDEETRELFDRMGERLVECARGWR